MSHLTIGIINWIGSGVYQRSGTTNDKNREMI